MTLVGVLGSPRRADVDERGAVTFRRGLRCDWLVGADDRWHLAARDAAVRQRRLTPAPALETAMRVPGGDALQRVYGVGGPGDLVVVEVENASPAPFVVGLVVTGGREVAWDEPVGVVQVDGRPALVAPRRPGRWAVASGVGDAVEVAVRGNASDEPLTRVTGGEVVLLWPVTHRTTTRFALVLGQELRGGVALASLPSTGEAVAGWSAQLRRGMQVTLPDERLQRLVDEGRADALLAAAAGVGRRDAGLVAVLEDWGFDDEAGVGWQRLGWRARRAARRRSGAGPWSQLIDVRDRLVRDRDDGRVELLSGFAADWRGASLDVRDAPTRRGRVSYSIRWHGEHPALLWEMSGGDDSFVLTAPALDPTWSTTDASGDALLGVARRV